MPLSLGPCQPLTPDARDAIVAALAAALVTAYLKRYPAAAPSGVQLDGQALSGL